MAAAVAVYHAVAGRGGAGAEGGTAGGRDGLVAAGGAERGWGEATRAGVWGSAAAAKASVSLRGTVGVEGGEAGGVSLVGGGFGCREAAVAGATAAPGQPGVGMGVEERRLGARVLGAAGVRGGRRDERAAAAGAVAGALGIVERVTRMRVGVSVFPTTRPLQGVSSPLSLGERRRLPEGGVGLNLALRVRGMAVKW